MNKELLKWIEERHAKTCRSYQNDGWVVWIEHGCFTELFFTVFRRQGTDKRLSVFTNKDCQRIRVNSKLVSETWWKKSAKPTMVSANSRT